jgi:nitronate monooxygenase
VGTRFLVAEESQYSDVQKRAIVAAKSGSAVRSYVFDHLRDTTGWPAGVDGRALAIPAVAAVESGADVTQIKEEVAEGMKSGDPSSVIAWAGTGVGQLSRLQPAKVRVPLSPIHKRTTTRCDRILCGSYMKPLWHTSKRHPS